MGIPPGVPVKATKSIGPCPRYCRADCPGTQRPAHPPGRCPGVPAGLPAGRTATHTESTLYLRRTCSGRRMTQMGQQYALRNATHDGSIAPIAVVEAWKLRDSRTGSRGELAHAAAASAPAEMGWSAGRILPWMHRKSCG